MKPQPMFSDVLESSFSEDDPGPWKTHLARMTPVRGMRFPDVLIWKCKALSFCLYFALSSAFACVSHFS